MLAMSKRTRISFDGPEELRRGLNIRAAIKGITLGELVYQMAQAFCPDELAQALREIGDESEPAAESGTKPRTRKP